MPPVQALTLLVVTDRPAVRRLFAAVGDYLRETVQIAVVRPSMAAVAAALTEQAVAHLAVIDLGADSCLALRLCRQLALQRPGLPILAVWCCQDTGGALDVHGLLSCGASGIVDLYTPERHVARTIRMVLRGHTVVQLRHRSSTCDRPLPDEAHPGNRPAACLQSEQVRLILRLVAQGLTDGQIGKQLHLSQHTVDHRLGKLRHELGVQNRTELAAWAGDHGLYEPRELRASRETPHAW